MYDLKAPPRKIEGRVKSVEMIAAIHCAINFENVVELVFEFLVRINASAYEERLHTMPLPVLTYMEQSLYCIKIEDRTVKPHDRNLREELFERSECIRLHRITGNDLVTTPGQCCSMFFAAIRITVAHKNNAATERGA